MRKRTRKGISFAAALIIGMLPHWVQAAEVYNIKYGEAATLDFALYDSNSPWALYETAPATADCNLFRDQGSSESLDNAITDEGPFMSWQISAAEAQCKVATLVIKDASSPPLFMDKVIHITTFGNASALHAFDLDDGVPPVDITHVAGDAVTDNGDGRLEVNVEEIGDSAVPVTTATLLSDSIDTTVFKDNVRFVLKTAIDADPNTGSVWERLKTLDDAYTAARAGYLDELAAGNIPSDVDAIKADTEAMDTAAEWAVLGSDLKDDIVSAIDANSTTVGLGAIVGTVATQGTTISCTLSTDYAAARDAYTNQLLTIIDAGDATRTETRRIRSYSASRVVVVDRAFSFTPAVSDVTIVHGYQESAKKD